MINYNYFLRKNNLLTYLLIVNSGVFLLMLFIELFSFLFTGNTEFFLEPVVKLFAVPASLKKLIWHFWTPLTYMFLHTSFWHFLFNMLWLYFMGILFVSYINDRSLLAVYILGGISGAVLFVLFYNLFPVFNSIVDIAIALGASASITAIVIAIALYQPFVDVYIFGIFRIKLFWIAIFFVLYDLFSIMGTNAGGHIAHLGGAIFGFFYAWQLKKGTDITRWFTNWFFTKIKKDNFRIHYNEYNMRTHSDKDYNQKRNQIRQELDRILEKISKKGYDSLSKKEREFLNKYKDYI